jgi:hypothetical protein
VAVLGRSSQAQRLAVSTPEIDLGDVRAGGCKEADFAVTNPESAPVSISRIDTSCECLTVDMRSQTLQPGETVKARAAIDMALKPEFAGGLALTAKALDADGKPLFAVVVNAEVSRD